VLAPRLEAIIAEHPELALEVVVRDQIGNLVADGFDAAVRFGDPPTGLIARRLLQTRILTCASPSYLARHGHPRHPRDLARNHTVILFLDPQTGRPFDWEFHQGKKIITVPVHGRLIVNDVATAIGACVAGHGIAQLMEYKHGASELLRSGALVELFPRWHDELFPLYVFYPSRHLPPAKVRAFVDFVVATAADPGPARPGRAIK